MPREKKKRLQRVVFFIFWFCLHVRLHGFNCFYIFLYCMRKRFLFCFSFGVFFFPLICVLLIMISSVLSHMCCLGSQFAGYIQQTSCYSSEQYLKLHSSDYWGFSRQLARFMYFLFLTCSSAGFSYIQQKISCSMIFFYIWLDDRLKFKLSLSLLSGKTNTYSFPSLSVCSFTMHTQNPKKTIVLDDFLLLGWKIDLTERDEMDTEEEPFR